MKSELAHVACAGLLFFFLASCERGVPGANDADVVINGYRIEGQVLDGFLRPLVGVRVILYYGLAFASGDSVSRAYSPTVQGEYVTVEVKNAAGQAVRVLFAGPAPQDSMFYVPWDGRDDGGAIVRSGMYAVTYTVTGTVKKSYRQIVDGNQNDTTNVEGRFVIPEADLPIGEIAPYYDSTDEFVGEFEITDQVYLRFVDQTFARTYRVAPVKNRVTKFSVVIN